MLSEERRMEPPLAVTQRELVGETPFVRLKNSGDGLVSVKLEAMNPGGSYFDRVAKFQLVQAEGAPGIIVTGTTSHTVSMLSLANACDIPVHILVRPGDPSRLLGLIQKMTGNIEQVDCAESCEMRKQQLESQGFVYCSRTEPSAHRRALTEIALESIQAFDGERISHWLLVDYGRDREQVAVELRRALGYEAQLHFINDDFERERTLNENAATRRVQIGHREGMLVGPLGAELIDRAVSLAFTRGQRVCAIVPDGGHRYLGWW